MLKNISKVSSNIKPYTSKDIRRFLVIIYLQAIQVNIRNL